MGGNVATVPMGEGSGALPPRANLICFGASAAASAAALSILPLAASPDRVVATASRAAAAAPDCRSKSRTRRPAWAAIWAMPRPMAPAPTMPRVRLGECISGFMISVA